MSHAEQRDVTLQLVSTRFYASAVSSKHRLRNENPKGESRTVYQQCKRKSFATHFSKYFVQFICMIYTLKLNDRYIYIDILKLVSIFFFFFFLVFQSDLEVLVRSHPL